MLLEELPILQEQTLHSISAENKDLTLILKIQEYIFNHMTEDISINHIADFCSYSDSRIRVIFRDYMGTSLGSYIRQSKMNNAAKKLGLTDLSVTEISELCGFSSVYSFSRGFKNLFGISPAKYRAQIEK